MAAPLYASHIYKGPRCPVLSGSIEPEIAFVLARDLPARDRPYSDAEVDRHEARLGWNIASRTRNPKKLNSGKADDHASNQGLYLGPAIPGGRHTGDGQFISIEAPANRFLRWKASIRMGTHSCRCGGWLIFWRA
jgi:hypothetical protein